jgi:DnaJ-domain-containing protein 1
MHTVMWEGSGWTAVNMSKLLSPAGIRKTYLKAVNKVHSDKTVGLTDEQQYIAATIFHALERAYAEHTGKAT